MEQTGYKKSKGNSSSSNDKDMDDFDLDIDGIEKGKIATSIFTYIHFY